MNYYPTYAEIMKTIFKVLVEKFGINFDARNIFVAADLEIMVKKIYSHKIAEMLRERAEEAERQRKIKEEQNRLRKIREEAELQIRLKREEDEA